MTPSTIIPERNVQNNIETPLKHNAFKHSDRIIRLPELVELLGLSRSTIFRRISSGHIPPAFSLGERSVGWSKNEIEIIKNALVRSEKSDDLKKLTSVLVYARKSRGGMYEG